MQIEYDEIRNKIDEYYTQYKNPNFDFYYRGQANSEWNLVPSIKRKDIEACIIGFAMNHPRNIATWDNNRSSFDNIAHMQHYGLPTRFLDFTTDFNIALYFACCNMPDKDGKLYICRYMPDREMSAIDSQLIAELATLRQEIPLIDFCDLLIHKNDEIMRFYNSRCEKRLDFLGMKILVWLNHGFMVTPTNEERENLKKWNPRLFNQKGAFFVCGNKTKKPYRPSTIEARWCVITPEIEDVPDTIKKDGLAGNNTILIPKEYKKGILEVLDKKFGINKEYVYPKIS